MIDAYTWARERSDRAARDLLALIEQALADQAPEQAPSTSEQA